MLAVSSVKRDQLQPARAPLHSYFLGALALLLVLAGCGGSSDSGYGSMPPPSAEQIKACSTAFDESVGLLQAMAAGKANEPVLLSQCTLGANRDVTIGNGGCGPNVIIDKSFVGNEALGKITIEADGKLVLPRQFSQIELHTKGISVAGTLSLGTASCPVGVENPASQVKVVFTGKRADADESAQGADKGIAVLSGGVLRLYGAKGVVPAQGKLAAGTKGVSWTHLAQPAGPTAYQSGSKGIKVPVPIGGERILKLARDVTEGPGAWGVKDWIVVATSSFSPFESEFVQISRLSRNAQGGTDVELVQALRHYHFGGADPGLPGAANYNAGKANYGVDERSEVGLISRNVMLTSQTPSPADAASAADLHWGGEVQIHEDYKEVVIEGVELEKFGKERLGSYPIHFHMVGVPTGSHLINSNSIHHSYNKCITVHSSQNLTFDNNVCARAVGHLFYQEIGDEEGISFRNNLGLGAMSHYFGIDTAAVPKSAEGKPKNWWEGDNLAPINDYDGLNVRNMDKQSNPVRGGCYTASGRGDLLDKRIPDAAKPCDYEAGELYVEQSSGFWIVNPGTVLEGNAIGGCQGMGKGYWYVVPTAGDLQFKPVGTFRNNRVHACYDGVFAETEKMTVTQQLFPKVDGKNDGKNLITRFEGLTATRNRNRGIWIRPTWNVIENSRFATNRDSATLVSSGGPDGNAPGVWALMQDSVLVGVSDNNVERWGPCPTATDGENNGCVDYNPKANELADKRYQTPFWNSAGYMVYDGPVRIFHNHFVNFLRDPSPLLTKADADHMKNFKAYPNQAKLYEGDAAFGWFQSNQSAYPTASTTRALSFENVDLRHQIYTEHVNQAPFKDGDKNTALIDLDGTLTGFRVVGPDGKVAAGEFAISLNNLPFNRASNAVDECLATGEQDAVAEDRSTSIISPANMATLEFDALYPTLKGQRWQDMIFTKTSKDGSEYQSMALQSRNGQGLWEPKLTSGYGYIVESAPSTSPEGVGKTVNGMPNVVQFGFTDAVKPDMDKKPFYVRLGIRYVDQNGRTLDATDFQVQRGYRSWGGNGVHYNTPEMRPYFNRLDGSTYGGEMCFNLNEQNETTNLGPNGCPANGVMAVPISGVCPAGADLEAGYCIFKKKSLAAMTSLAALTNADGTPSGDNYFYDSASGILFLYVQQDSKNAHGIFPLGSCPGDAACPDANELDTYFPCPPQGCVNYSIKVDNTKYTPGNNPQRLTQGDIAKYALAEPQNQNRLAYVNEDGSIGSMVVANQRVSSKNMLHWMPDRSPVCPVTSPAAARSFRQAARSLPNLTVATRPVTTPLWRRWLASKPEELPKLGALDLAALPVCRATQ